MRFRRAQRNLTDFNNDAVTSPSENNTRTTWKQIKLELFTLKQTAFLLEPAVLRSF